MKKICWVQHASEWPLFIPVAEELKNYGYESIFVCKDKVAHALYLAKGWQSVYAGDCLRGNEGTAEPAGSAGDERYGPPGVQAIGESDIQVRYLFGANTRAKKAAISRTYDFWERFLEEHKIDLFIVRETAMYLTRTAHNVARARSIPLWQLVIGPADHLFTLDDVNENHIWSELVEYVAQGPLELSAAEGEETRAFISKRLATIEAKMQLRFVPPSLFSALKNVLGLWIQTKRKYHDDPIVVGRARYGWRRQWQKIKWKYVTSVFFRYDSLDENARYVYFPVYSGLETSYLANDHYWAHHEVSLIREIAQSLPEGVTLCIKEHPTNPGDLSFSQLRKLQRRHAVKVLHPSVSSVRIVKKSAAVCVLEGTTGWEAFLQQKPVICLGNTFFSYSSLVYKVGDLSQLAPLLWTALKNGSDHYRERVSEWLWFIHGVYTTSSVGMSVRLEPPYGFPDDVENARNIARGIHEKLTRHLNR